MQVRADPFTPRAGIYSDGAIIYRGRGVQQRAGASPRERTSGVWTKVDLDDLFQTAKVGTDITEEQAEMKYALMQDHWGILTQGKIGSLSEELANYVLQCGKEDYVVLSAKFKVLPEYRKRQGAVPKQLDWVVYNEWYAMNIKVVD